MFILLVGEAAADKPTQESRLATDGVPGELGRSAPGRSVVGRHHSTVCRCLLRRNDPGLRKATTIYSMYALWSFDKNIEARYEG